MVPASPAQQRRLLDLQHVDTAIRKLEHRRAHLPEQQALDANADTLARISAEYAAAKERNEHLASRQAQLEREVATIDARRRSEEGRMYSGLITSEKELGALRHELSSLRAKKSDLEDELLEIMEEREGLESLVESLKARHGELTSAVAELTAARDAAAGDIDADLRTRHEERRTVVADVPGNVVAYYDELRARKDGVAVAELQGATCQGCRLQLTPIELEELRDDAERRLPKCPQCDRILVAAA